MTIYRRKKDSDMWHWCTNCDDYPKSDYVEIVLPDRERPSSGELDNQCRSKESKGKCETKDI